MPEEKKAAEKAVKTEKSAKETQPGKLNKILHWFATLPQRIAKPFKNMYYELKKVTWPSKQKLISYSCIVLAFMLVMGVVIGLLDMGASAGVRLLIPKESTTAVTTTTGADENAAADAVESAAADAAEAVETAAAEAAEAVETAAAGAAEAVESAAADAAEAVETAAADAAEAVENAVEEAAGQTTTENTDSGKD